LALARVYGFLPRVDEEPTSSMERRGRRMGAAHWDGSSSSPWNLTLLAGVADNTEEDGRGRGPTTRFCVKCNNKELQRRKFDS
jgi:hypothetical protein